MKPDVRLITVPIGWAICMCLVDFYGGSFIIGTLVYGATIAAGEAVKLLIKR